MAAVPGTNAHPQSLAPTEKLLSKFTCFFGCFVICVLFSPSGECYFNCMRARSLCLHAGTQSFPAGKLLLFVPQDIQCVLMLFSVPEGQTVELLLH